jgi:hypothetical protein
VKSQRRDKEWGIGDMTRQIKQGKGKIGSKNYK